MVVFLQVSSENILINYLLRVIINQFELRRKQFKKNHQKWQEVYKVGHCRHELSDSEVLQYLSYVVLYLMTKY